MTAPLSALLAAAWTLLIVIGVWSVVGLYRLDRKPRRGGETGASAKGEVVEITRPRRPCGAAGPRHRPPEIRAGGPQT